MEIDVPNAKDFFVAGSFAYVTLHLAVPSEPQVPVNALVLRDNKQYVVVSDSENIVHFRPVELASTDGGIVRVGSGLKTGEKVVLNVPDEIVDGSHIQAIAQLKN